MARTWATGDTTQQAIEDLFLIRPLLSRTGDVADFSNINKQVRLRKNEKVEKFFFSKERTGKGHRQRSK